MNIKQTERAYLCRLFALVSVLAVCGHFLAQVLSGSWGAKGLFLFIYSFHMPLLITLSGMIYGRVEQDRRQAERIGAYSLCIYLVSKTLVSLARLPFTGKFAFMFFTEGGAPWIFFTIGVFFLASGCLKKVNKNALLIISLALSLASGFISGIGDFLVLSRTLVFFPYFVMGWMFSQRRWEKTADSARARMAGAGVLLLALAVFLIFSKDAYFLRPFFTARASYEAVLEDGYAYGPLFRAESYAIGTVLTAAVLMAVPAKSACKLTARIGESFTAIYVLHRPLLYILTGFGIHDALQNVFGPVWGRAAWMLCTLVCLTALSWKPLNRPFAALFGALTSDESLGTRSDRQFDRLEGGWERASAKKRRWIYVGVYTAVFTVAALLAFSPYISSGKTFVWYMPDSGNEDGGLQHYPALMYIGRYLRRFALNLLHGELALPMVDMGINLGGDVIGTLNGNEDTDPLYLLAAFVPSDHIEYLYLFLSILRMWLAGLSFSYLCFYHKKRRIHALTGSLVYCFSAFACINAAKQVYFLNPMIQLPLLLVGTDKILKKEKPWLFVTALLYSFVADGYYFSYQMTIMIVIYAAVRFFDLYSEHRFKQFMRALGRGAAGYVLALGLSAVIFLPSLLNFLNAGRAGFSSGYVPTVWTWSYIRSRFLRLILPSSNISWAHLGLAAIVLPAIAMLLGTRKKRTLKILLCIGIYGWMSSIGGFVMHGFQYSVNRWLYGLVLLLAYVVVDMLPELTSFSTKQRWICSGMLILYTVIAFSTRKARRYEYVLVAVAFLAMTLWVLAMQLKEDKHKAQQICAVLCVGLVAVNVGVNGIYRTASDQGNYIAQFRSVGKMTEETTHSAELASRPWVGENPMGRVDSTEFLANMVEPWFVPTLAFYDSMLSKDVVNFWNETENRGEFNSFKRESSNQCTLTNELLSVKYQIEKPNNACYLPYGYTDVGMADGNRTVYENKYALPWGYTYETAMSYEQLEALNGLQQQEAMLQAVALEKQTDLPKAVLDYDDEQISYQAVFTGCEYENGVLTVKKDKAFATLTFAMPAGTEGYVRLAGLNYNGSGVEKFKVKVTCGEIARVSMTRSDISQYYDGQEDFLFNLGYSENERTELTITFPLKGTFKLDGIELYALPMDNYPERVEALRAEPLENIQWGTNSLTGTVDLSKDKILCVSVPYSKGWSATVDGEKAEILRGNYMFMCLPLTAGHHDIEFHYCSPGIKLGAAVTVCSLGIVAWMIWSDKKKRKAGENNEI